MNFVTELTKRCTIIPTKTRETVFTVPCDNPYGTHWHDTPIKDYKQFTLRPHKLIAFTEMSNEVSSIQAEKMLKDNLSWDIDKSILFGDGIGKPLGIVNSPGTVVVESKGYTKQTFYSMRDRYNGDIYKSVWLLKNPSILEERSFDSIMGIPVVFVDSMPGAGELGSVILADLSKYVLTGDDVYIEISDHNFFNDTRSYRATYKIDGKPTVLSPYLGTSPFVVLGGFRVHDNVTGKIIVICMHCGEVWNNGTLKCWDGYRGCGGPLEEPGGHRVVCTYCGRIWPNRKVCWDGEDGCGGLL